MEHLGLLRGFHWQGNQHTAYIVVSDNESATQTTAIGCSREGAVSLEHEIEVLMPPSDAENTLVPQT
jgi:hypothetical protein